MKNLFLYSALGLGAAMLAIHVFAGGALIARPLLESDLPQLPRLTLYLCWHGVTVVLAGLPLLAADALFWRRRADSAYLLAGLAAAFACLGAGISLAFGLDPLALPQWIIFTPLTAAAFFGARALQAEK